MTLKTKYRGSVTLVALCFVAVLGIGLAAYLSVSKQAMTLSNNQSAMGISRQLAEMGIERALAAFNRNDWTGWTLSGTTATRTITFPSNKYGTSGVVGTIKLRIDDYNVTNLDATWTATTVYAVNDLVGRNGIWYRCLAAHTSSAGNQPPNLNYWAQEGVPWQWNATTTYTQEDVVCYNGTWYRYTSGSSSSNNPPPAAQWTVISAVNPSWPYPNGSIREVWYGWELYSGGSWNEAPVNWRWRGSPSKSYKINDTVDYDGIWYKCIAAHSSSEIWWPVNYRPTNTDYWRRIENFWPWSSSETYNIGDVVYRSSAWYRCIRAHSNQGPPNTTYWATTPPATLAWSTTRSYSTGSIVSHEGTWYRSLSAHSGQEPPNATYWTLAPVIYAEGNAAVPNGRTIKTQLRATLSVAPLFPNAVAASDKVNFSSSSSGGVVDSYDASLGTYNQTSAPFTVSAPNLGYSAVVAGGSTSGNAVTFTRGTLNGYVAAPPASSSPYGPLWTYGGSAVVRGTSTGTGIDFTRVSRSPYIPQYDVQTIAGGTQLSGSISGTVTIGTPGATTPTVYYISSGLDVTSGDTLYINGPVILDISGRLYTYGGKIVITPTGSAVIRFTGQLYLGDFSSNGIQNTTLDPTKLTLIGTSTANTSSSHYLWSTLPFYGTIYMPNAHLTVWSNVVVYGALSAKNITFPYKPTLHYDTSLRHAATDGVDAPYVATEVRELTDPAERISL